MYSKLKHMLFYFDPEVSHDIVESTFRFSGNYLQAPLKRFATKTVVKDDALAQTILGINFPNPVGMAAGFDKNATMVPTLTQLGFGSIEVGTITPKPQGGNPKPRLFRHVEEASIQNAMGFNNDGLLKISKRIKSLYPHTIPLGINIGKNKLTPEDKALDDYETLLREFSDTGDYVVINISSPNTPGLRDLQNEAFIKALFTMAKKVSRKPIFLKIAPDMEAEDAVSLSTYAVESGADGIIATNTTIDYSLVANPQKIGGISGKVLKEKSRTLFQALGRALYGKTTLVSVGGIDDAEEAYVRIKAGASLIQVYTSFIFKGPMLAHDINVGLLELLRKDGYTNISQAVGADYK